MKGIMFNEHYGLELAVLEGRKTQTRRVDKNTLCLDDAVRCGHKYFRVRGKFLECHTAKDFSDLFIKFRMPYEVGEVVAIKQSYEAINEEFPHAMIYSRVYNDLQSDSVENPAPQNGKGWTNKMFVRNDLMPHQIKITNIRVEKLQDISSSDCIAEGVVEARTHGQKCWRNRVEIGFNYYSPRFAFEDIINAVSGKGVWQTNPFVWVIEFKLIK